MKTIAGVVLNLVVFFAIWFFAAFITISFAFIGLGNSGVGEYLRLGVAWFICPGIGGYYAPKITSNFISDINMDSVISSFVTIIAIIFLILTGFSFFTYSTRFGGSVLEMVQLVLQFASIIIGTLVGKMAVKVNT